MRRLCWVVLLAALPVRAEKHRGSLGLTVAAGGEFVSAVKATGGRDLGPRIPLEIAGTLGLFEHTELRLAGRLSPGFNAAPLAGSIYLGARNSFALGDWNTFFDLDFATHVAPFLTFGARLGFGAQWDFSPVMGLYAQVGAQLGGGVALRLSFEGMIGLQFRTYVFE